MMLLKFSFVLGGLGAFMTFNGFTLLLSLPGMG
jgi:hypothetical protein